MQTPVGIAYTPTLVGYDTGHVADLRVSVIDQVDGSAVTTEQAGVVETNVSGTYERPDMPAINDPTTNGHQYLIVWRDMGTGDEFSEDLIVTAGPTATNTSWEPMLEDVGALLLTRTMDDSGDPQGTFNANTQPTAAQAQKAIDRAVRDLEVHFGTDPLPTEDAAGNLVNFNERVQNLAELRAAMYIELTHFPEQVKGNESAYAQYRQEYLDQLKELKVQIAAAIGASGDLDMESGPMPSYSFPERRELRW